MTLEQHNERLVLEKQMLQQNIRAFQTQLLALVLKHGEKKGDKIVYRIPEKMVKALEGYEAKFRSLKTGQVIELIPREEGLEVDGP